MLDVARQAVRKRLQYAPWITRIRLVKRAVDRANRKVKHEYGPGLFPGVVATRAKRAAHRDGAVVHDARHREAVPDAASGNVRQPPDHVPDGTPGSAGS